MKIQINNIETLERLIGNDNELEFNIRQSVVESFTKKHLKSLANDGTMLKVGAIVQKELSDEFLQTVKQGSGSYYVLAPKLVEQINQHISNKIGELVRERLNVILEKETGISELKAALAIKLKDVEAKMERHFKSVENESIKTSVKIQTEISGRVMSEKIEKMVKDGIAEKLNRLKD